MLSQLWLPSQLFFWIYIALLVPNMKERVARGKLNTPIKWVKREEWGAMPPRSEELLDLPARAIMLMDTSTEECFSKEHCTRIVQGLQKKFMEEKNFDDIPWSYLIAGDGHIYEGRGSKLKTFKTDMSNLRMAKYDGTSIDIAYIGNFESDLPDSPYFEYSSKVIEDAIARDVLADDSSFESFLSEYKFK